MAHPQLAPPASVPALSVGGGGPKPDKLPHPTISEGVTQTDWVGYGLRTVGQDTSARLVFMVKQQSTNSGPVLVMVWPGHAMTQA